MDFWELPFLFRAAPIACPWTKQTVCDLTDTTGTTALIIVTIHTWPISPVKLCGSQDHRLFAVLTAVHHSHVSHVCRLSRFVSKPRVMLATAGDLKVRRSAWTFLKTLKTLVRFRMTTGRKETLQMKTQTCSQMLVLALNSVASRRTQRHSTVARRESHSRETDARRLNGLDPPADKELRRLNGLGHPADNEPRRLNGLCRPADKELIARVTPARYTDLPAGPVARAEIVVRLLSSPFAAEAADRQVQRRPERASGHRALPRLVAAACRPVPLPTSAKKDPRVKRAANLRTTSVLNLEWDRRVFRLLDV